MIDHLRWLLQIGLIVLVAVVERIVGVPILTLAMTNWYAVRLDKNWRWGLIFFSAGLLSTLSMLSLSATLLIVSLNFIWFRHGQFLLQSRFLRLMWGSVVSCMVVIWWSEWQWQWWLWLYVLLAGLIIFFGSKRRKFV
jgi:hypothetical protein